MQILKVRDSCRQVHSKQFLIDSGSQVSAITSNCRTRLGLNRRKFQTKIVGNLQTL